MHNGYEEDMAPPLDVNDTDEDKSNNSIVHEPFQKPSSENLSMDVSESECSIVNETLSHNDSSDVLTILRQHEDRKSVVLSQETDLATT